MHASVMAQKSPESRKRALPLPIGFRVLSWMLRLSAAAILLQTLFFKFTASEESVYIFTQLGMEPWGRIGTGIAELIASILLLLPPTVFFGAVLGMGLMAGAIGGHLTQLGISVQDDGGLLFTLAVVVFCASAALAYLHRFNMIALAAHIRNGLSKR